MINMQQLAKALVMNLSGGARPLICVSDNDSGSVATGASSAQNIWPSIEEQQSYWDRLDKDPKVKRDYYPTQSEINEAWINENTDTPEYDYDA
jgi:hypothetical protein